MALRRLRGLAIPLLLAALGAVLCAWLYLLPLGNLAFANRIADYRVEASLLGRLDRIPGIPDYSAPDPNLALITIDEESIGNSQAGLGAFPFPRSVYGRLLRRLAMAGARVVAFDVDFLEPSADPSQDAAFLRGAQRLPTIAGYTITTTSNGIPGAEMLTPSLASAVQPGFTTIDTPGGVVVAQPQRIKPMPPGFPSGEASSLALAAAERYEGHTIHAGRIPSLDGAMLVLPFHVFGTVDQTQRAGAQQWSAPFVGQQLSFADALTLPISDLRVFAKGHLVLIGATAQAEGDFASTVFGLTPGVYVHARLIDQILRHRFIRPARRWLDLTLILILPLILATVLTRLRPVIAMLLAATAIIAYVATAALLFGYTLYWLDIVHVCAAMLFATLVAVAYRVITEATERRAVTDLFGRHVSPAVVKEILHQENGKAALALAGKRAKATIFYSDIRGFTAMSERMTPEEIYGQLNEYFEAMCEVIFRYDGYVDKFIGDCIMAVFSAPNQSPDDALKAVNAALDQQEVIASLARRWESQGRPPFSVGMGINTGEVVMGNLGAQKRMNYTVIGDDVNVAARLYNVALGGQIIISESTYREVQHAFDFKQLDPVSVKGKSEPLATYEVLRRKLAVTQEAACAPA